MIAFLKVCIEAIPLFYLLIAFVDNIGIQKSLSRTFGIFGNFVTTEKPTTIAPATTKPTQAAVTGSTVAQLKRFHVEPLHIS